MRRSALPAAIALVAFSASIPAFALDRRDIQGFWRHPDTGMLIEIYPCDGGICAKVASTPDPNLKDVKNPDPSLRDRPVAGLVLWRRPKESGDLQWIGTSYNTADGGSYYGTMRLTNATTLAVSACNLSVMHCADATWTKAGPQPARANFSSVSKTAPAAPAPPAPVQAAPTPTAPVQAAVAPTAPVRAATAAAPAAAAPRPAAPVQAAVAPAAPVRAATAPASAPAAPRPAAAKPKRPVVKAAEKPKAPPAVAEEKPKEPERPRDPYGYEDLPHIRIAR